MRLLSMILAILATMGCSNSKNAQPSTTEKAVTLPATLPAGDGRVTGTVTYLQRVMLPPQATVKVQLVDVSRMDAPAEVIGEQVIPTEGKGPPFTFSIAYDPATIEANHSYAVQARVEVEGQLRFITDQRYPVITRGAPTQVEVVLKQVDRSSPK